MSEADLRQINDIDRTKKGRGVAIAQTPLGRIGQPNDIASIAVFLASDDSYWLTGEHLLAGGSIR